MRGKRLLLVFAALILTVAGCASGKEEPAPTPQWSGEPLELVWLPNNFDGCPLSQDTEVVRRLEERFNVDITVTEFDAFDENAWNLFWAASPHVDVITGNLLERNMKLISGGLVRPIPEGYLETYMPTWMKAMYEIASRDVVDRMIRVNGGTYFVPYAAMGVGRTMVVRQDWLDRLGMKPPSTPEEFMDMLVAFTYSDPDGNGVDDTYGMHGGDFMRFTFLHTVDRIWPNAFWTNEEGKVYYTSASERYKANLKRLNAIYSRGVIDPEFATDDRVLMREKCTAGQLGVLCETNYWLMSSTPGNVLDSLRERAPNARFYYMEPFVSDDGQRYTYGPYANVIGGGSYMFGAHCSDEAMIRFMEIKEALMKDFDFFAACYYGEQGYGYDPNGVVAAGEAMSNLQAVTARGGAQIFVSRPFSEACDAARVYNEEHIWSVTFNMQGPKCYMNTDFVVTGQNEGYSACYSEVSAIADAFYFDAVAGRVDIDQEWDSYVSSLYSAGLDRVLEGYQAMVDGK